MSTHTPALMEKPSVCRLHAAESVALSRALSGQAWCHGLYLGMTGKATGGLPGLECWTHLCLDGDELAGALRARADETLPFADDAFRVVVLSHALEWTPHAAAMLDEAVRVLAPEGLLAVTGFHPCSAWMPWLLCRRKPRPMLTPPGWVRQRLAPQSVHVLRVHRCGAWLPTRRGRNAPAWLGAGFVLVARKQRVSVMKLKTQALRQHAGQRGAWAPGTHRECA